MGCGMDVYAHDLGGGGGECGFLAMYSGGGGEKFCDTGGRRGTQKWPATVSIVVF